MILATMLLYTNLIFFFVPDTGCIHLLISSNFCVHITQYPPGHDAYNLISNSTINSKSGTLCPAAKITLVQWKVVITKKQSNIVKTSLLISVAICDTAYVIILSCNVHMLYFYMSSNVHNTSFIGIHNFQVILYLHIFSV